MAVDRTRTAGEPRSEPALELHTLSGLDSRQTASVRDPTSRQAAQYTGEQRGAQCHAYSKRHPVAGAAESDPPDEAHANDGEKPGKSPGMGSGERCRRSEADRGSGPERAGGEDQGAGRCQPDPGASPGGRQSLSSRAPR